MGYLIGNPSEAFITHLTLNSYFLMEAISIFGIDIYWQGVLLGLCTFLIIGVFHPIVIKAEYYFGTRPWWIFLLVGIVCGLAPFFISSLFWGALSAIVGFSSLWGIGELFDQRKRVIKGWFPMNPKRKHEYPEDSIPYGGKL